MSSDINAQINALPPVEAVRAWAKQIVAARGDAFAARSWAADGLYIDAYQYMGENPMLVRENVGFCPRDGQTNIVRLIEVAAYPAAELDPPFWHKPERTWKDVPVHRGKYNSQRYNEIHLPFPLAQPLLVRVVQWIDWVPELRENNIEVTYYTLLELDPDIQRTHAEALVRRAAHEAELRRRRGR